MNKTLLIIGGVAALGIVGYLLFKSNKSEESMSKEGSDMQKSADTSATAPSTSSVNTPVGTNAPIKGGTKTDISGRPVLSSKKVTPPSRSVSIPKMSNETESYAFSLNF